MTPHAAFGLVGGRAIRRAVGCGCLALAAVAAIPVVLVAALVGAAMPDTSSAADPTTALGGVALPVAAGEPLQAGHFQVTQGFGCTRYTLEPLPPPPYRCPPDGQHPEATHFHSGIDLAAAGGDVVRAVVAGTVRVIHAATGFGLHIVLTPPPSGGHVITYLYGHLSGSAVVDGDRVVAGAAIGYVGSSGNSTGPHLHFEVDVAGTPVNPCALFPPGYLVPAGVAAADCLAWAL